VTLLDKQGRLFGRLNLIDLLVIVAVCLLATVAYVRLTVPYRVAPPFALSETTHWTEVLLQIPAEQTWTCDVATKGIQELDPRSGEPTAEVLGCTTVNGFPQVHLKVRAVQDANGRLLFENDRLVPGRQLTIETDACTLDGIIAHVGTTE
jgi:hypothetical protein